MNTYVVSDIHGNNNIWKLLNKVGFNPTDDILFVNGDIIDRGPNPIGIFRKLIRIQKEHPGHIYLLLGNHELFLKMYLQGELAESVYKSTHYGGTSTLKQLAELSETEVHELVDYINEMSPYEEINHTLYGASVIIHVGISAEHSVQRSDGKIDVIKSIEEAYADAPFNYMISSDIQRGYLPAKTVSSLDKFLILGHVPTMFVSSTKDVIIREKYMLIDGGSSYQGGKLLLYRIEDGKTFSAKRIKF